MHFHTLLLASGLVAWSSARSTAVAAVIPSATTSAASRRFSTDEPCASIAILQQEAGDKIGALVPAELAYQCLQSVPVDKDGDLKLIDEIKLSLEWNTDTSYFKNLPDWYDNPSFDLHAELDAIKAGVRDDTYRSEWEVQSAIAALTVQTGDGHIVWQADINTIISFARALKLVSVSIDGISAPQVFVYDDVSLLRNGAHNLSLASVKMINGEDTATYLHKIDRQAHLHDSHARHNALFVNQAGLSINGNLEYGYFYSGNYDGASTTYTFSNGTNRTLDNVAKILADFTSVESGASFFSKFCQPKFPSTSETLLSATASFVSLATPAPTPSSGIQAANDTALGYPSAQLLHSAKAIGGYYLEDIPEVAILSIPSFDPGNGASNNNTEAQIEFQDVAREFLKKAAGDKKSKLVVDLRFNHGGDTVLAFSVFKLLFPNLEPYQATRYHAHQAYQQLTDFTADNHETLLSLGANLLNATDTERAALSYLAKFVQSTYTTPTGGTFETTQQFYGPHQVNNDSFTSLSAWNLSSRYGIASEFPLSGYGGELATSQPAWNSSDILLLQDGWCSSTCAIFSELMYTMAGVQTLAVGGLPDDALAMQKVGGTKGWLTWELSDLQGIPAAFYGLANQSTVKAAKGTEIEAMNQSSVLFNRARTFQVNAADGIRRGDEAGQTPLQFVYEAAECRLWYTVPMVLNVTATWKAAVNVKWGNGTCNAGKGFGNNQTQIAPSRPAYTGTAAQGKATDIVAAITIVAVFMLL